MSRFLYNEDFEVDVLNILAFLEGLADEYGSFSVSMPHVETLCRSIQVDFPYREGHQNASAFKKVANFVLWFCQLSPVTRLPDGMINILSKDVREIKNHQNIVIALLIGFEALFRTVIVRSNGDDKIQISNRIELSNHSFVDVVDAIGDATPQTGFKLLTVMLEQLVYKTNPDCQYDVREL